MTRDGDGGSASLWVLSISVLVSAACVVALTYGAVVVGHRRAAAAADLSALAGASAGAVDPCRAASAIATSNGARLESCRRDVGGDVVVAVSSATGVPGLSRVVAWARAGQPLIDPSTVSSSRSAPGLSNGSFPFPHLGD